MPTLTTTIEDTSPLIIYTPSSAWRQGSGADNMVSNYSQASFTLSNSDGATMSFTFNGTGVQIFGARRGNHGTFVVAIDGQTMANVDGKAANGEVYQDNLFSIGSLQQGLHTLTLKNNGTTYVDVDFITWQSTIGKDNEHLIVNTIEDTDTSFVYHPVEAWSTNPDRVGSFSGGTGHVTSSTPGASLTYTFSVSPVISFLRDGVSLFGPIGPNGSPFTVQVDGGPIANFTSTKMFWRPQERIYHVDSLGAGNHTLKLVYQPVVMGQVFAIDYAQVYTAPSLETNVAPGTGSSPAMNKGMIAGIAVLGAVCIISLCGLAFLFWRLKSQQSPRTKGIDEPSATLVEPFSAAAILPMTQTSTLSREQYGLANRMPEHMAGSSEALIAGSSSATASGSEGSNVQRNRKGQVVLLPSSTGQSLSMVPVAELRAGRREVEGRPQDFGSAPDAPPDYSQATERYEPTR